MQRARHSFFKDRAILYSAMLAIQAKKDLEQQKANDGEDIINNSRYQMPRVISVWICNFRLEGGSTEYHDEWNLYSKSSIEKGRILPVTDVLKYIFLELPNFKKAVSELETTEDRWLYALKNMGEEGEYPETLGDSAVRKAYERLRIMQTPAAMLERQVENMVTEAEIEERIWENTQKGLEQGRKLGLQLGLEQGLEQGIEKGALNAKREMAKAMLADGVPVARIEIYSGLSEAEILAL
jgi:predicted transposase/invertase (TIGR01784 family)